MTFFYILEVGFHRISVIHKVDMASGKVMIKSEMKYEGSLKKYTQNHEGEYTDCDLYAILEEELRSYRYKLTELDNPDDRKINSF